MLRVAAAVLGLVSLLMAACDGSSQADSDGETPAAGLTATSVPVEPGTTSCSPTRPWAAGETRERIDVAGLSREYILRVPPAYDAETPLTLIIGMHGLSQGAEHLSSYTRLREASDAEGFVYVAPEALGAVPAWNQREAPNFPDDLGFIDALLTDVSQRLCIDTARVFMAGFSNGGGMTHLVACRLGDRLAAVAIVAGVYIDCEADMPVVAFHGIDDEIVPFEGGPSGSFPQIQFRNVRRALSEWGRAVGCDGLPVISRTSSEVELSTFQRCATGDDPVLLYSIVGGGHTWPGTEPLPEAFVGATTQQIDATQVMLKFFEAHPRP